MGCRFLGGTIFEYTFKRYANDGETHKLVNRTNLGYDERGTEAFVLIFRSGNEEICYLQ